jgi:hypothetical protein
MASDRGNTVRRRTSGSAPEVLMRAETIASTAAVPRYRRGTDHGASAI